MRRYVLATLLLVLTGCCSPTWFRRCGPPLSIFVVWCPAYPELGAIEVRQADQTGALQAGSLLLPCAAPAAKLR